MEGLHPAHRGSGRAGEAGHHPAECAVAGVSSFTRRAYNSPPYDFPLLYLLPTPPHPLRTPTMTTAHTAEEIFTVQAKAQLDSEKPQASSVPGAPLALDLDSDRATHLINLLTDGLVSIRDEDGRFLLKRAYFTPCSRLTLSTTGDSGRRDIDRHQRLGTPNRVFLGMDPRYRPDCSLPRTSFTHAIMPSYSLSLSTLPSPAHPPPPRNP